MPDSNRAVLTLSKKSMRFFEYVSTANSRVCRRDPRNRDTRLGYGMLGVPFDATAIAEASHFLTSRCTEVVEARIASGGKRGEFQFESDASAAIP